MSNHGRNRALAALGAAIGLALCLPGPALAAHDLRVYKAEKQVDLNSDYADDYVECQTGDYALDGMWRIEHVDYDEDETFNSLMTSTDVLRAERNSGLANRYDFSFVKNSLGRTQVKIWVTCLGMRTEQDGPPSHDHPFVYTGPKPILAADATGATNVNNADVLVDDFATDEDTNTAGSQACKPGEVAVSPGWHVASAGAWDVPEGWGRVIGSTLQGSPSSTGYANRNSWKWSFRVANHPGEGVTISTSIYCLRIKVGTASAGTSQHKLIVKRNKDWTASLPAASITERSLICGDHYKAMVAGWWLTDPANTWFMGMDPRLKSRAFRFLDLHGSAAQTVDLAGLCFNYRTT